MLEKIAKREGFGDILADGIRKAAEKYRARREPFAMEIGGEELPMHDPKLTPDFFTTYKLDPTPARHTQWDNSARPGWNPGDRVTDRAAGGRSRASSTRSLPSTCTSSTAAVSASSSTMCGPNDQIHEWINAVTGWDMTLEELKKVGRAHRATCAWPSRCARATTRRSASCRGGWSAARRSRPARTPASPSTSRRSSGSTSTPATGISDTCRPSRAKLDELGLQDVAKVLHG